tara:strand:+ start:97 stop:492 length:396 start_codon:yes stop_codon:yes gene_type:complete
MQKRYLKKIIAQSRKDLQFISACCSEGIVKLSEIKFLPKNKIFLLSIERLSKEKNTERQKINSIIKFDYIDSSRSKNINHDEKDVSLQLLAINLFKRENNYEITLLFSNNRIITLSAEIVEVTLEDQKIIK